MNQKSLMVSKLHNLFKNRYACTVAALTKIFLPLFLGIITLPGYAQQGSPPPADTTVPALTIQDCIDYAVKHQPEYKQTLQNIAITRANNAVNLAGFYPQVSASGNYTYYLQRPTAYTGSTSAPVKTGVTNVFTPALSVTQSLFSPALNYAYKTAPLLVKGAEQDADSAKIEIVSAVTKTFYSLLLTMQQVKILKEDTVLLGQSYRDAYNQYKGGIVDETDYEQAMITLNNTTIQLKQADESIVPQYASLKQVMGYPPEHQFNVSYDSAEMMKNIYLDTAEQLAYSKRIELQKLDTERKLQQQLTAYYAHAFLPTVSAFYDYNLEFESNTFSKLFSSAYPNSLVGLSLSVPIFTGFSRIQNLRKSKLQEGLYDLGEQALKSSIYSQYTSALASYKSNLYSLNVLQENVRMSKRVYFVVTLQYRQGIVPYLNVLTAESNLITSETSYYNSLFQTLSSKIDVQKAMGDIPY